MDILKAFTLAFKKNPKALLSSVIRKMMNFFADKAGLKPSDIVRCPGICCWLGGIRESIQYGPFERSN